MKNIVLIGMPGAGKSTIGVVLAKMLGYDFIDSDLLIQKQEGDILENLISRYGRDGFEEIENRVNRDIDVQNTVISTGGSVCYCGEALEKLAESSVIVYLKLDYASLAPRLGDLKERGVVIEKGATLLDLYNERVPLYERYADLTVDLSGYPLEKSIAAVRDSIKGCSKFYEQ
ncbi:MAG: shikimate kinase [Lachnospiraceae bacterium]|jgi:shikimate kinase